VRRGEIFVDSGAWIAVNVEPDVHHGRASALLRHLTNQRRFLVTTNLIVAESYEAIRRVGGITVAIRFLDLIADSPRLLRIYSDSSLEQDAEGILRRYHDQRFSYVDAVSFAVMRDRAISEAFAFDRHFETAGFALVTSDE
jgi:predicted nucleic acid-binding protein